MKKISTSTYKIEPLLALFLFITLSCDNASKQRVIPTTNAFIVVLGIAQDAGYPQAGQQEEWALIKERKARPKNVVALALVDPVLKQRWLFEATPDFKFQLQMLDDISETNQYPLDGIFLTHAHIGHYTGLMNLGREAMGTSAVPVYAMPKMQEFLTQNGPWSQLVALNNIKLKALENEVEFNLNPNIKVTPFLVPHRDEFSETVGYSIEINGKSLVFIPDIDKWTKWDKDILEVIKAADYAFLDASFYKNGEIPGRDMNEIPHPFVEESMSLFESLSEADKAKVHFIHFNHTNPLLFDNSPEYKEVKEKGFNVAYEGQIIEFK
ncbi:MAG: pyrroloquinoline quinone biosynthesis protein B [Arcticibacterium sp.]|jgi:pyrroloquinoline quinone biosynthesis protein B